MTEETQRSERDENRKKIFDAMYSAMKVYGFLAGPSQIESLKTASSALYETIEKIAEHRAKVICGEFIKTMQEDIGAVLDTLNPDKDKKS